MNSIENDIDGQILMNSYEATFTITPPITQISLSPTVKNVMSIWLSEYDIRGVPVVAGIPVKQNYFLELRGIPMLTRVGVRDNPVGNAVPLLLTGAWTQKQLKYPAPLTAEDMGIVNNLTFKLMNEDGTDAVYDVCTLQVTFKTKTQPHSLSKLIAARPQINNNLAQAARPWIV